MKWKRRCVSHQIKPKQQWLLILAVREMKKRRAKKLNLQINQRNDCHVNLKKEKEKMILKFQEVDTVLMDNSVSIILF